MLEPDRPRIVDERAEHPAALGEVADRSDHLGRHAHVDELLEAALGRDDPESAVLGVDEFDGCLHDALEHDRQFDGLDDRLRRPEQGAKPTLRAHDLAGALHDVLQRGSSSTSDGRGRTAADDPS